MKPIHPIFVHFPIALLALSVAADAVAFFTDIDSLRNTGGWALFGAAAGGVVTAATGVFDMRRAELTEQVHERVHRHMKVGLMLTAVVLGLAAWRLTIFLQGIAVSGTYLDCAILAMALAGFQGWLGGELVYSYGVSVQHLPKAVTRSARTVAAKPKNAKHEH